MRVGNLIFVAGHAPFEGGRPTFIRKLGRDVDVRQGKRAAELVALNMLASLKAELADLGRIARVVKLLVFVNSDSGFGEQPAVADGASDLLVAVFGPETGRHARSAVGMATLPFGISVEIEGIFELA